MDLARRSATQEAEDIELNYGDDLKEVASSCTNCRSDLHRSFSFHLQRAWIQLTKKVKKKMDD
jgi:hypothetical protein